jgi:hypothetical protein
VFFSKIWFFLVAAAAIAAFTIALVMPRPAQRAAAKEEQRRIKDSCAVVNILLTQNARVRIDLAAAFARAGKVPDILDAASKTKAITAEQNSTARAAANGLINSVKGEDAGEEGKAVKKPSVKPDFVILLDRRGRVVVRAGIGEWEKLYGDSLAGYYVVDDALSGFLRDDLWLIDETLYRVAAAPVVHRGQWAGAVILGHDIDREFATRLAKQLPVQVSFYAGGRAVGTSDPVQIHNDVVTKFKATAANSKDRSADCQAEPFPVSGGGKNYSVLTARLPGEAGINSGAFYSVFIERPTAFGFSATLGQVKKDDLSMGNFPWFAVMGLLLGVVGIGMFLQVWESDLPLKRLAADAVALAKGDKERLEEDRHKGKYGSIARSVNIQLDKMHREAKAAKKDLDQLLGPAPAGGASTGLSPAPATASLPLSGPGGPAAPGFAAPPPSEFQFSDSKKKPAIEETSASPFDLDLPPPPPSGSPAATKSSPAASATDHQVPPKPVSLPGGKPPPIPTPPPLPGGAKSIDEDILASAEHKIPDQVREPEPPPARPATPAPRPKTPEPAKRRASAFDEEPTTVADPSTALLEASAKPAVEEEPSYFRKVYDEFIALKKKCGESTTNLTFEKFSSKLEKNRAALIAKHGCKEVKFQVYIKDGKAALKASPVKG